MKKKSFKLTIQFLDMYYFFDKIYAQDKNFTHDHNLEVNKLIKCHCTPLNHKMSTLVKVKGEPYKILCFKQFDITRTGTIILKTAFFKKKKNLVSISFLCFGSINFRDVNSLILWCQKTTFPKVSDQMMTTDYINCIFEFCLHQM